MIDRVAVPVAAIVAGAVWPVLPKPRRGTRLMTPRMEEKSIASIGARVTSPEKDPQAGELRNTLRAWAVELQNPEVLSQGFRSPVKSRTELESLEPGLGDAAADGQEAASRLRGERQRSVLKDMRMAYMHTDMYANRDEPT